MGREFHVRFCEGLGVQFPRATRLLVFGDDKGQLAEARGLAAAFLAGLRLRLHPDKSVVFPVRLGIRFLGYRIFRSHRLLAADNVRRFRRRLRRLQGQYARYAVTQDAARQSLVGWIGHARQADTYRLRRRLFDEHPFRLSVAARK
jgi:hypothetical protein